MGQMRKLTRSSLVVASLLPVVASLLVLVVGRPNGPLIVVESGTVGTTPALCSSNPMCHVGPLTGGSVEIVGTPESYLAGQAYDLELEIQGLEFLTRVYGFQLVAFFPSDGSPAGKLVPLTAGTQIVKVAEQLPVLTHTDPLVSGRVSFRWIAPTTLDHGDVLIRVASNSADGNFSPTNDLINTDEVLIPAAGATPGTTFYFPQIGVGRADSIRFSTDLIFLNTGSPAGLDVRFFNSMGNPLQLSVRVGTGPLEQLTRIERDLGAGQTFRAHLSSDNQLEVGYAVVLTEEQVGGTALFTQTELLTERIQYQAGVPATRTLTAFSCPVQFDPAESNTGVALVRPPSEFVAAESVEVPLVLRLYDESFELLAIETILMLPGQHIPRFVSDFFSDFFELRSEPFRGSLTVESPVPVAPLTLLQTTVPTLAPFPVIPGRAADSQ